MRDPSPYAGQTVKLRADARELGGQQAEVIDWYENWNDGVSWRDPENSDVRAAGYRMRRAMAGLPEDEDVFVAQVDGLRQLIHLTEIEGATVPEAAPAGSKPTPVSPSEVGEPCLACRVPLADGDMVAVLVLGPGADPAERFKARHGIDYNAQAVELHWACRTGDESYQRAEG